MPRAALLLVSLLYARIAAASEPSWSIELAIGDAFNASSETRIQRDGHATVTLAGDYETRGLEGPVHYSWRVSRWQDEHAWELQLLHHKLYLRNRPPDVAALSVSHGFNIITLNRAFDRNGWQWRIGLGPVVTHAEAIIEDVSYDGPYELAGAAAFASIGKRYALTSKLYLTGEIAATVGYIEASPSGSPRLDLRIFNPAMHAQLGIGYRLQ